MGDNNSQCWQYDNAEVYWKYEHRITCTQDVCTTLERDRFQRSVRAFCSLSDACNHICCLVARDTGDIMVSSYRVGLPYSYISTGCYHKLFWFCKRRFAFCF
jgi:hypothetical protein